MKTHKWFKVAVVVLVAGWVLAYAAAKFYTMYDERKDDVVKPVHGDPITKQYCKNMRDGLRLENGGSATVTKLVQLAGTPALKTPPSLPTTDKERAKLNSEQPYYTSGLFLSLVGEHASPGPVVNAHSVVRTVMLAAQQGEAPADPNAALDAAGKIDRFIADKCTS